MLTCAVGGYGILSADPWLIAGVGTGEIPLGEAM